MAEQRSDSAATGPDSQGSVAPPYPGAMPRPAADAPEPEGKPKFFDRPLAKDPIFWTGLAGMVVLGSTGAFRNPSGSPLNPAGLMVSSLDAAVPAAFGWFLAGFLPALIRRLIRRSRRKSALRNVPSTNEPSWQQDPVKPGRYRWWDGTAWGDVVAPPPARGPNKVAWLLVPAFLIVLLAAWAGGLASPSGGGVGMAPSGDGVGMAQFSTPLEARRALESLGIFGYCSDSEVGTSESASFVCYVEDRDDIDRQDASSARGVILTVWRNLSAGAPSIEYVCGNSEFPDSAILVSDLESFVAIGVNGYWARGAWKFDDWPGEVWPEDAQQVLGGSLMTKQEFCSALAK